MKKIITSLLVGVLFANIAIADGKAKEESPLAVSIEIPPEVRARKKFKVVFTIKNTGKNLLEDVKLQHTFTGLTTKRGNKKILILVDDLGPGEKRNYYLELKAPEIGEFINKFTATSKNNISGSKTITLIVKPE